MIARFPFLYGRRKGYGENNGHGVTAVAAVNPVTTLFTNETGHEYTGGEKKDYDDGTSAPKRPFRLLLPRIVRTHVAVVTGSREI